MVTKLCSFVAGLEQNCAVNTGSCFKERWCCISIYCVLKMEKASSEYFTCSIYSMLSVPLHIYKKSLTVYDRTVTKKQLATPPGNDEKHFHIKQHLQKNLIS